MTPYYQQQWEEALRFQDYVMERFYKELGFPLCFYNSRQGQYTVGENMAGVEIKQDKRFSETGNLYVETAEKADPSRPSYSPSGICRNDNTWLWVQGDYTRLFIFGKTDLLRFWRFCPNGQPKFFRTMTPTSQGFLLPVPYATKWALKVL